ncbi:dUTPase [Comamonas aquatica]|uniref:dUTPase n=1 Tax=Comamonas aquatica TaxID=225991 RepID=UPI002446FAFA|nr:dUTPase [Comamonas aquatica]MDH1380152.1 dUTPase [Comamonas aquatica]MDH1640709.1 dUTPase [Comamonas aquatica]
MKSQHQMIADMLALQAQLNDRAYPAWRTCTPDYALAIISECSELIDSVGWKWWKKQEPRPLVQTQMEVVDIWHFVMSSLLASGCAVAWGWSQDDIRILGIIDGPAPLFWEDCDDN